MKRAVLSAVPFLLLCVLTLPFAACGEAPGNGAEVASAVAESGGDATGTAAGRDAGFRLPSLDGEELGPPDYAGQVVLVDFWATWCVPCHAQAEVLKEVHAALDADDGVQFLAVDVGETETQVRGFVEKNPFPWPVLLDPQSRTADSLRVYSLPTLMVLDRQGEVSYLEAGVVSRNELCGILETAGATEAC